MRRFCLLRCGGEPAAAVLVPEDREPDHHADNHLLVEGVYVEEDGSVTDQGYEEGPDQGSNYRPLTPEEASSADDGRGDHVELEPYADDRLPLVDHRGGYHAAKARRSSGDHVHARQVAPYRYPREPGGLQVRAHRVGVAPGAGAGEHDVSDDRHYHDHENRYRYR